ncbi:MAG: GntR family transcriptional regulator [Yaniella sp.]|uniref:GntR family transcriptional regulator n=1 Tax=Yaniella sp. TaxID=2773929 RepID=UPI003F9B6AEA
MDDGRPLFLQIAEKIEASILDGSLAEEDQAPSTNELSAFYRVNPATAGKGINLLVDRGILVKRRGLGTFVAPGAQQIVRDERVEQFAQHYLDPLLTEARAIGLDTEAVLSMIRNRHAS